MHKNIEANLMQNLEIIIFLSLSLGYDTFNLGFARNVCYKNSKICNLDINFPGYFLFCCFDAFYKFIIYLNSRKTPMMVFN